MSHEIDQWILPEMGQVINHRRQIFERYKASNQQADHLESLAQRVQALGRVQPVSFPNLTAESVPPQELDQAMQELERELDQIQATKVQIQGCEEEIKRLKHRRRLILISLACLLLVAAIWLLAILP